MRAVHPGLKQLFWVAAGSQVACMWRQQSRHMKAQPIHTASQEYRWILQTLLFICSLGPSSCLIRPCHHGIQLESCQLPCSFSLKQNLLEHVTRPLIRRAYGQLRSKQGQAMGLLGR